MRSAIHAAMLVTLFGLMPACGDKLDPVTAEPEVTDGTETPVTPINNGNNVVTNPNMSVPPVTNPNTPTTTEPTTTPTTKTVCGTNASTISYATHVGPLVNSRCGGCHGSGGKPPAMTTFANTKSAFISTNAKDQVDSGSMPQGSSLSANQICIIDTWTETGYAP